MPHNSNGNRRNPATAAAVKPALATALALLLACLGLAACGGSSSSSSSTTASAASATTPSGPRSGRFVAVRECLRKNGVTLPQRPPGTQRPPGAGGFLGGGVGPRIPQGMTRAQYEAALKKCGGGSFRRGGRLDSPAFRQALVTFEACMRQNGVNLPAPNTGGGPVFDTKGLNTTSPRFKSAYAKCQSDLRTAFRRPGAGGGGVQAG
jgi:hypothetical protein